MKIFIKKFIIVSTLVFLINMLIGTVMINFDKSKVWSDFYKNEKIDIALTGSSHCAFGIDPKIIENRTKLKVFNLSSPAQSPKTAYFLIDEIINRFKPKVIVQDLFFMTFYPDNQFINSMIPLSQTRISKNGMKLWFSKFTLDEKILTFFPAYFLKSSITSRIKSIPRSILKKNSDSGNVVYYKGFYGFEESVTRARLARKNMFDNRVNFNQVDPEQFRYMSKTARNCQRNGIKLVWITIPIPKASLAKIDNYREISVTLSRLADQNGIQYIDYNLRNDLSMEDEIDFKDADHLNVHGSLKISSNIAEKLVAIFNIN